MLKKVLYSLRILQKKIKKRKVFMKRQKKFLLSILLIVMISIVLFAVTLKIIIGATVLKYATSGNRKP